LLPQRSQFRIAKHTPACQKSHPLRGLDRKARSPARDHIDDKLRLRPIFELGRTNIKKTAGDLAEEDVAWPGAKLGLWETHGRAAVAASARLMKQKRSIFFLEPRDEIFRLLGRDDTLHHHQTSRRGHGIIAAKLRKTQALSGYS